MAPRRHHWKQVFKLHLGFVEERYYMIEFSFIIYTNTSITFPVTDQILIQPNKQLLVTLAYRCDQQMSAAKKCP